MTRRFLEIASTPAVLAIQASRSNHGLFEWVGAERGSSIPDSLGPMETAFIAERDSFYMATVSETGWPYVQHRGGPKGFLRILSPGVMAFADYRGNRQYISTGNLAVTGRAALILVDYVNRARLKLYVRAESLDLAEDPALTEAVVDPGKGRKPERIMRLLVEAFDWNCPQHITPRYTETDLVQVVGALRGRIAELEAENARLRAIPPESGPQQG